MEIVNKISSIAVPLDRENIDTDAIIPKQFLKKIERSGFGVHLFHDWRYLDETGAKVNPDFILNKNELQGARILVTGGNFGCGSSREHAPWSLYDWGFRAIIAPSFADIFYSNSFKIGLLLIKLPLSDISYIFSELRKKPLMKIDIDLAEQSVSLESGKIFSFEIDPQKKVNLLKGLDDIGLTLEKEKKISDYEVKSKKLFPWLWQQSS